MSGRTLVASLEPRWSQGSDASRRGTRLALCTGGGSGAGRAGALLREVTARHRADPARPSPRESGSPPRADGSAGETRLGPGPPGPTTDPLLIIFNRLMGGGDGGAYG